MGDLGNGKMKKYMGKTKIQGCKQRIQYKLFHVRQYAKGIAAKDWEGTFWKDKKLVKVYLIMAQADLNILYDELDELTATKNVRVMI